jgi:hypothetical protein
MRNLSAWLMSAIVTLFMACSDDSKISQGTKSEVARGQLLQIENELATDRAWIEAALASDVEKGAPQLGKIKGDLPSQINIDGIEYDIRVSLYDNGDKGSLQKMLDANSVYGVMLDPDRFYPNQTEVPLLVSTADGVEERIIHVVPVLDSDEFLSEDARNEKEAAREAAHAQIQFPIFCIDIEKNMSSVGFDDTVSSTSLNKSNGPTTTPQFLTLMWLKLRESNDDGNEEFEIYGGQNGYIGGTTPYIFDGQQHQLTFYNGGSTYNYYPYFPDVNNKAEYTCPAIPLFDLDEGGGITNGYMVAIEDDDDSGVHERGSTRNDTYSGYTTYLNLGTRFVKSDDWTYSTPGRTDNNDDIYNASGIAAINKTNIFNVMYGYTNGITSDEIILSGSLAHVNYKFSLNPYPLW